MTNADKFKNIFGLYATELWSMPEKDFLKWLNSEAMNCSEIPNGSDDTISRQAVIDLLKQMRKDGDMIPWEGKDVFARIRKLPSAQPERKKGKWIDSRDISWMCSECGKWLDVLQGDVDMNFCPNCGAKMEGE